MPDAEVLYFPQLFSEEDADSLFFMLREEVAWVQEKIKVYGKVHDVPRLTAWYGDSSKTYTYSGIKVEASPWIPVLLKIKRKIEAVSSVRFNSVLLNRYRGGSDSVSWHADDEPELGSNPVVGSVSFGQSRPFQMKHKLKKEERRTILLEHGSYLLMRGSTQHYWQHQIPKTKRQLNERVNLTFRIVS